MSSPSANQDNITIAALTLSVAAILMAILAFNTSIYTMIYSMSDNWAAFGPEIMGKWARYRRRRFSPTRFAFDILYQTPVFFLAPTINTKGPLEGKEIWYADGTQGSCDAMGVETEEMFPAVTGCWEVRHRSLWDDEQATWLRLLTEIQRMERESINWETRQWMDCQAKNSRPLLPEVTSLAVGIQRKTHVHRINTTLRKPYAHTTICHIIELAAVLSIYWKEFSRETDRYRAEGNGYCLIGSRQEPGLVFAFERIGHARFQETRVIPTSVVKQLCFGIVPTLFASHNIEGKLEGYPFQQNTLTTLQLGSLQEIAETLSKIGCNSKTSRYFLEGRAHTHLFPVVFELIGMLSLTCHVRDRCFTYLPNPTIFQWDDQLFSRPRLLQALAEQPRSSWAQHPDVLPLELEKLYELVQTLAHEMPLTRSAYSPLFLNLLHDTIDQTDNILSGNRYPQDAILAVMSCHIQEVLGLLNLAREDVKLQEGAPDTSRGISSFDELLEIPLERREREFIRMYFSQVQKKVLSGVVFEDLSRSQELMDASGQNIWCILVTRMICWLLLHDFNKRDIQIFKSDLINSIQPVYII